VYGDLPYRKPDWRQTIICSFLAIILPFPLEPYTIRHILIGKGAKSVLFPGDFAHIFERLTTMKNLTIPATFEVANRNGDIITVNTTNWTPETVLRELAYGVKQDINDAAASALADAYEDATGLSGKDVDTIERKAWGRDNPQAVYDMRETLRANRRDDLESNIHGTTRSTGRNVDPLDKYRLRVVGDLIRDHAGSALAKTYAAIDSKDAAGRKAYKMQWAASQSDLVDPVAQALFDADQAASESLDQSDAMAKALAQA